MSSKPQRTYGRKSIALTYAQRNKQISESQQSPSSRTITRSIEQVTISPHALNTKRKHADTSDGDDELLMSEDEGVFSLKRSKFRRKRPVFGSVNSDEDTLESSPKSRKTDLEPTFVQGSSRAQKDERHNLSPQQRTKSASSTDHMDALNHENPDSSPRKRSTKADTAEPSSMFATPKKQPKDLSKIFDTFSPSPSPTRPRIFGTPQGVGAAGSASVSRKMKMLTRTRTESSIELSHEAESHSPRALGKKSQSLFEALERDTESGEESPSGSPKTLSKGHLLKSRPQSPSKSSSSQSLSRHDSNSQSQSQSQSRNLAQSTTRTYADSSRSFRVAISIAELPMGLRGQIQEEEAHKDSYLDLREKWGVDSSEPDPLNLQTRTHDSTSGYTPNLGLYNPLSSITELRSKGESRRFMDEIGYLFEGLDAKSSIGLSRSSALEMVGKFCEAEFRKRAKAAGFVRKAWEVLRGVKAGEGDKVLDAALAVFIALIADDTRHILELSGETDFIKVSVKLLPIATELDALWASEDTKTRATVVSASLPKLEMSMLMRLRASYRQATDDLSLSSICARIYEALSTHPPLLFPYTLLLLENITTKLTHIQDRIDAYTKGLPLITLSREYVFEHATECLQHCLCVLDEALVNELHAGENGDVEDEGVDSAEERFVSGDLARPVVSRGLVALIVAMDVDQASEVPIIQAEIAQRCKELSLRILVNLTNENKPLCKDLVTDKLLIPALIRMFVASSGHFDTLLSPDNDINTGPSTESENRSSDALAAQTPDTLLLGLALLTNVIQEYKVSGQMLKNVYHSDTCPSKHKCLLGCICSSDRNAVHCLVSVYESSLQDLPDNEPLRTFLRGHLAVLLGLIILQDVTTHSHSQYTVLDQLLGTSRRSKLDGLIQHSAEFCKLYTCIAEGIGGFRDSEDSTSSLAGVINVRKEHGTSRSDDDTLSPSKGSKRSMIATKVIASLVSLRDKL